MGRPSDWSPLGLDSDPAPGDPGAITAESRRLGQTVGELRSQIAMLEKISSDTTLKGQYAGTLRAHAQQLTQDLDKVAARYEQVADATSEWSGNLAEAQAQSLAALQMAEGPYEQLRRMQAPQQPPAGASASAKQQYATDKQQYQQAESSAQDAIQSAQRLLGQATSHRDTTGARAAAKISNASHDSLADSWWDQFKQAISNIAGHLKAIATVIGYLATIAAILAVVLTGPLALVFLLIAGGLLLTELGIHTILAATGNGSWIDVGLDVVALATLGYGGVLDAGAESLEEGAENAASLETQVGLVRAGKGLVGAGDDLAQFAEETGDENLAEIAEGIRAGAMRVVGNSKELAEQAVKATAEDVEKNLGSFKGVLKSLVTAGSHDSGNALGVVTKFSERFADNEEIAQALKSLKPLATKNAVTLLSGTAVDFTDKGLGLVPGYDDLKDHVSTYALPADIGIPVVDAAEDFAPVNFIVHATEFATSK